MVKRILIFSLCLTTLMMASLALAGGKGAPVVCAPQPCAPAVACGPTVGPNPAFWGDAPFPGICGGVVALPFLVVGSLLGGNTVAPPAAPMYGQPVPRGFAPVPMAPNYAPPVCGPVPVGCGPAPYGAGAMGGGLFGGLPCLELCSGILGGLSGGFGLGL